MSDEFEAPTPSLLPAFELLLDYASPCDVGEIATGGFRRYLSAIGGTFEGEGLAGKVSGGGETHLTRADGVTVVEASYYIAFADGAVARCFGTGYQPEGGAKRLTLLFEAAETGSVAALATRAFIGEQLPGQPLLAISRII